MRAEGFSAEGDLTGRSLKAQMKYANKIGAKNVMVLGDSELDTGIAKLKNMSNGTQSDVALDKLVERIYDLRFADMADSLGDNGNLGEQLFSMFGTKDSASKNKTNTD